MVMILFSQMMKKYNQILSWIEEDDKIMIKNNDKKIDKKHEYIKINDFLQILSIYRTR
jgi:hypothetical protein